MAPPGVDLAQSGIVIAGMADQLPGYLRKVFNHQAEQTLIQRTGGDNGQSPIRRCESCLLHRFAKLPGQAAQDADLRPSPPQTWRCSQLRALNSLAWIPYRPHSATRCRPQERTQYAREGVSVFVRVKVSDLNAGGLQFANLGGSFRLDLIFTQPT